MSSSLETLIGYLSGSNGTLNIYANGFVDTNSYGFLGYNSNSNGTVTVGGLNALWDITSNLYVGGNLSASGGTGTLTVNNYGRVQAAGLTVWNGASSITTGAVLDTTGGVISVGGLTLKGGAVSHWGFVGTTTASQYNAIYTSGATVSGSGALWSVDQLRVGHSGAGTLNVASSGSVTGTQLEVGTYTGSNGVMNITGGGQVTTTGRGMVGFYQTNATGQVTVSGSNSLWDVGGLYLGGDDTANHAGIGSLTVTSLGTVKATTLKVWNGTSSISTGTAAFNDGTIDVGTLTLVGGGQATSYWGYADNATPSTDTGIYADTATVSGANTLWDTQYFLVGNSGTGTATVSGAGKIRSAYTTVVGGGNGSNGTLNINAGGTADTNGSGYVGSSNGSTGIVNVSGSGALWDIAGNAYVGGNSSTANASGTLTLSSGGKAQVTGSLYAWGNNADVTTGPLNTTSGGGSLDISGMLSVQNGGQVTSYYGFVDNVVTAGTPTIAAHTAEITGTNSRWDTTGIIVGRDGAGTLTVTSGGVQSSVTTSIGRNYGSNGTLNVNAGGTVDTSGNGFLAYSSGATGTVTVGGSNALWDVTGGLYVGGSDTTSGGTGTLTVNNGGTVQVTSNAQTWSTGTVAVNSSGLLSAANIDHYGDMTVAGSVQASNGITVRDSANMTVNTGGDVTGGLYTLAANGNLFMNGGTLNAGYLDTFGNFNFNAGAVNVTNNLTTNGFGAQGSIALGKFDTMTVGGATTLNDYSTLDINGGSFSTGSLVDNGGFAFNSGTFRLTGSNLVFGAGGLFGSNVAFDASRTVHVTNNVTIDNGAILGLDNAVFSAGTWTNNGTVDLAGSVTSAGGGTFTNNSLLSGNGTVSASLDNSATGEVRATLGDTQTFNGVTNSNDGTVNLLGGTAVFDQGLTNNATGFITGHGALVTHTLLTNNGQLAFTDTTDVQGDVNNDSGGSIVVAGQTTTFYDDVIHNGAEFRVMSGAQAVFFGSYSGAGSFTGTGQLVFAGDLKPGNSPALVSVQGGMSLWSTSQTVMEIAGLSRGSEYDAFDIGGTLNLAGTLDVTWYDLGSGLFNAALGDSFDLFSADTITGTFDTLTLAALAPGLKWQLDCILDPNSNDYVRLSVASVPLPAAVWLFGSGVALLFGCARRCTVWA